MSDPIEAISGTFGRPLRIAALVKQIPVGESMQLGPDRRLVRDGLELEMNAYCRRAISKGVEWAQASGGACVVFTLGPESADDVLREAIAWGATAGVHLCDSAFAGSDTLATAKTLAEAIRHHGPFDLILVGRNSLDGDTGQLGPELAELLDLPFAAGVRVMDAEGELLSLTLEHDDGSQDVEASMPVVLSVAERLCEPCKVPIDRRSEVSPDHISVMTTADLGPGPWGAEASPTRVGHTRHMRHDRLGRILGGTIEAQVAEAALILADRGALTSAPVDDPAGVLSVRTTSLTNSLVAVLIEPERPDVGAELLGAAASLADEKRALVTALVVGDAPMSDLGAQGADSVVRFEGSSIPEDVATAISRWLSTTSVWALLGPSTAFGREVLARVAASQSAGMVGDAIALHVERGELVAAKPAFSGVLVADISCSSSLALVTVRPGVLPIPPRRAYVPEVTSWPVTPRHRLRIVSSRRDDDVEVLARAQTVIGVGAGVDPSEYGALSALAAVLGAELGATRKVTDKGWAPRSRQIGVTGRSIAPRLYVALGLSGKFNHMVGVRSAGTVLAINHDPQALIFGTSDVGIVGDWHLVVPLLVERLKFEQDRLAPAPVVAGPRP